MNKLDKRILKRYNKSRDIRLKNPICRAPFANLYFSKNGDVLTCCFNREKPIGKYPDMSLNEIWNGKKIKDFQSQIKANALPKGCDICQNELERENFLSVTARRVDMLRIKRKYPTSLEFELDNTCNLECIMCEGIYSSLIRKNREKKTQIDSLYHDDFVDYITPFLKNAEIIRFGGGEPFLIDLYYKIWDQFFKLNSKGTIFVQTNGTVMNPRIIEYLKTGRFTLGVSVDSLDKTVFESIRKNADFDTVISNITEANRLIPHNTKFSRLLLSITLMRENWKDVPQVIKYAGEIGVQVGVNIVWTPKNHALFNLSSNELKEIFAYYKSIELPKGENWIFKYNDDVFQGIIRQIENWIVINSANEKRMCEYSKLQSNELQIMILDKLCDYGIKANQKEKILLLFKKIEESKTQNEILISIYKAPTDFTIKKLDVMTVDEILNLAKT